MVMYGLLLGLARPKAMRLAAILIYFDGYFEGLSTMDYHGF